MFYLLAIAALLFFLQSSTAVLFIKNAIVNLVVLLYLLIQELWRGARYLYTAVTTNTTAQILSSYILQSVKEATQKTWTSSQDFGAMAIGFFRTVFLGTLKCASGVIWSIWEVQDRVMNRLFPESNWSEAEASLAITTSSSNTDTFCLVPCAGYTDNGRCVRNKRMDGGIWYCWQHKRQDIRARM